MSTNSEFRTTENLLREVREQCAAWSQDELPASIAMENIDNLLAQQGTLEVPPAMPIVSSTAEPPIVAWQQAWNEGRRAFNDDRWPHPKTAAQYTRNPYDAERDFALHYWWARGNHGNASPVDNYGHIPSSLVNEDLGRSTPPPEPLDHP
ncbi:hypothetical protein ACIA5G_51355 [Amycolatopsis sp. NPDC051758]|uniref:hypothetical protein n=1 Tax=Amycolatopsis sp. NPDC051758 TaxID=3363935 RepID=UPI0037ACADC0